MILEQIKAAMLAARKARDHDTSSPLGTFLGDVELKSKNVGRPLTEGELVAMVRKYAENAKEMAQAYGDRRDGENSDKYWTENELFSKFLPKQMPEAELRQVINLIIANEIVKPKQGDVMKALKEQYDGQYDGKSAAAIAKELLA